MPVLHRSLASGIAAAMAVFGADAAPLRAQAQTPAEPPPWDVTRPRGAPRKISFTTDEGTWLSPDVSPDGRTIVVDMVGDIWLLPIEGGEARPLTRASGMALNYHAVFSPNGSKIAFISDRDGQENVWVMNADGSNPRKVSNQREKRMALPAWTPDGNYIIARLGGDSNNDGRGELWMWHIDGGAGVRVTGETVSASWPEVSPDGRYAFHRFSSFDDPGLRELVALPDHKRVSMIDDNAALKKKVAPLVRPAVEYFKVNAGGEELVDGYLLKPPDFNPS